MHRLVSPAGARVGAALLLSLLSATARGATSTAESQVFTVDLTGNAKGRDLQVYNRDYACLFKLQPVP